jgi:hypothetical protein
MAEITGKEPLVTIVLMIALVSLASMYLVVGNRRRAEHRAVEAQMARRAARRRNVPAVSNNLKGVTASQTIEPLRPDYTEGTRTDRAA